MNKRLLLCAKELLQHMSSVKLRKALWLQRARHCGLIANGHSQANQHLSCVRNMNCCFTHWAAIKATLTSEEGLHPLQPLHLWWASSTTDGLCDSPDEHLMLNWMCMSKVHAVPSDLHFVGRNFVSFPSGLSCPSVCESVPHFLPQTSGPCGLPPPACMLQKKTYIFQTWYFLPMEYYCSTCLHRLLASTLWIIALKVSVPVHGAPLESQTSLSYQCSFSCLCMLFRIACIHAELTLQEVQQALCEHPEQRFA